MLSARPFLPAAALALLLTACGSSVSDSTSSTSTKDALYFPSTNVPVAYVGEAYTASLQVAGGVGPYTLRLASGRLPDGLTLSGSTLSGKPTKAGLFNFTVEASDASLSTKASPMSLTVTDLPPLSLAFTLPTSEVRGETRIPLTVTAPRGMRAFRLQWTLPAGMTVTRIAPVDTRAVAFWKVNGGLLTLDMGFRGAVNSGDRLALVTIKPSKPVTLQSPSMGYSALGADGTVLQTVALPSATPVVSPTSPTATPKVPVTGGATPATQTPAAPGQTTPQSQPAPGSTTPPSPTPPVSPPPSTGGQP